MLYLVKDNDDFLSFCKCERAFTAAPTQADCPWCGCGWLFSCTKCRKAFTFARAVKIDKTPKEMAVLDLTGFFGRPPNEEEIGEWLNFMPVYYEDLDEGQQYVYFDGLLVRTDADSIVESGWHAEHHLPGVPQVAAMTDSRVRDEVLASTEYWSERRIED